LALLSALPPRRGERAEVVTARERGWAESTAEVIPGMAAIAAPIGSEGAVAVMWLAGAAPVGAQAIADAVTSAAADIAARL
jgi:DNA-binding IclR family transcriptional regulator